MRNTKTNEVPEWKLKEMACQALIEYDIKILPVPMDVAENICVCSMQFFADCYDYKEKEVLDILSPLGKIRYNYEKNRYTIYINQNYNDDMRRWTVAYGIAAIKLEYVNRYRQSVSLSISNRNSEYFTYNFLCPDIILNACDINTTNKIQYLCAIPKDAAYVKSVLLKSANNTFLDYKIVQKLNANFHGFIKLFTSI